MHNTITKQDIIINKLPLFRKKEKDVTFNPLEFESLLLRKFNYCDGKLAHIYCGKECDDDLWVIAYGGLHFIAVSPNGRRCHESITIDDAEWLLSNLSNKQRVIFDTYL